MVMMSARMSPRMCADWQKLVPVHTIASASPRRNHSATDADTRRRPRVAADAAVCSNGCGSNLTAPNARSVSFAVEYISGSSVVKKTSTDAAAIPSSPPTPVRSRTRASIATRTTTPAVVALVHERLVPRRAVLHRPHLHGEEWTSGCRRGAVEGAVEGAVASWGYPTPASERGDGADSDEEGRRVRNAKSDARVSLSFFQGSTAPLAINQSTPSNLYAIQSVMSRTTAGAGPRMVARSVSSMRGYALATDLEIRAASTGHDTGLSKASLNWSLAMRSDAE